MKRSPYRGRDPLSSIADRVRSLSRLLTRERDALPANYLRDPALRQAYRAYFLPANLPKVHLPLRELAAHPAGLLDCRRLMVLDIGTGQGTSVLGVLSFFSQQERQPRLEFTAVDAVPENLREAESLFAEHAGRYPGQAALRTVRCRAEEATAKISQRFDLLVISNMLNELFPGDAGKVERRADLVGRLMRDLLEEKGSCIVIEPALRRSSRELLQVRDRLLTEGIRVYSPCLMQNPCPALARSKDWCHEDRPWHPPEMIRAIDARAGLRKDSLKFSYVVLRSDGPSLADLAGPDAVRVVSEPLVSKGKREYYVCGPSGRKLAVRLDRDRSIPNEPFGSLRRGDLVRFKDQREDERRLFVTKEAAVVIEPVELEKGSASG